MSKKNGFVNQYGFPLGGCLFNKSGSGRHSRHCACANCRMWWSQMIGRAWAKRKASKRKAAL